MSHVDLNITGVITNGSATWWRDDDGHYVNSSHVHELETIAFSGSYKVRWYTSDRSGEFAPIFTTQAEASTWAQLLVNGTDPDA